MTPLLLSFIFFAQVASSQATPPHEFVDKGNCPGEGCAYGKWQAQKLIKLYSEKSKTSKVVSIIKSGDIVKAITGDVHTIAGIFILEKPFEHKDGKPHVHQPGERIYIYTYGGEGYYAFWCNGKLGGIISPDTDPKYRNGQWQRKPKSTWWAKIQTKNGSIGWTPETDSGSFNGTYEGDQSYIK